MSSLKEEALKYEQSTTKNLAELEVFDVNMELQTYKGVDSDGQNYTYKYIEDKDGNRYRVPWTVLGHLKNYLEEDPSQHLYKVKRNGEGKKTTYTTIPVKQKNGER